MKDEPEDYDLKTLIDLDGQTHWQKNHWIKISAKQVDVTAHRPHGIKYSLTLHDSNNTRIIGFDNLKNIRAIPWRLPVENISQRNLNLKSGLNQLKP
jgi:hypothetical protein